MNKPLGLGTPDPVMVTDLFPEVLDGLVTLLSNLTVSDWNCPTACAGWSARDVALHLLGIEIGNLSTRRDHHTIGTSIDRWEDLVAFINRWNEEWVQVARRISTPLFRDMIRLTGSQMIDYFRSLDPYAMGGPVSWAGSQPAPVWLDLAREYTERWHHQQHIREAVNKPGFMESRYLSPVLATYVRALPHTFEAIPASEGSSVTLTIRGEAESRWSIVRQENTWRLYTGIPENPTSHVILTDQLAWCLFTRGLKPHQVMDQINMEGNHELGLKLLDTVAIIA
jgi:uncharacterized protein (TIGR03083 family)